MKKLLMGLGVICALSIPVVAVVSCGTEIFGGVAWDYKTKSVMFNMDGQFQKGTPFLQYAPKGKISATELSTIDNDFTHAIVKDNVRKLNVNTPLTIRFTGQTTYTKDNKPTSESNPLYTVNYTYQISFKYKTSSFLHITNPQLQIHSNIVDAIICGLIIGLPEFGGSQLIDTTGVALVTNYETALQYLYSNTDISYNYLPNIGENPNFKKVLDKNFSSTTYKRNYEFPLITLNI